MVGIKKSPNQKTAVVKSIKYIPTITSPIGNTG